jgi:hypothetical protein
VLLAAAYAAVAVPSSKWLLLAAAPALLHTAVLNTHLATPWATAALRSTLTAHNFTLLARRESLTGYVSVLESVDAGYRVMRCDHSLLGGNWMRFPNVRGVAEPIYAIFVMLEAVRLVQTPQPIVDAEASALVVGLGIGTSPAALIAHGINTTIVEIDPVVHEFAVDYFGLPDNHTSVIDDAVAFARREVAALAAAGGAAADAGKYDYIVHDVFTGGAEPVELFTLEFLQDLHALLKPNGVIAINYAGDFFFPPIKIITQTVRQVFPACRAYRERERNATAIADEGRDFTNVAIFCAKHAAAADDIRFRLPRAGDHLRTMSRQAYLFPAHEVAPADYVAEGYDDVVLRRNDTRQLEKWTKSSAAGHWAVMRTVLPPVAWENW